MNVKLRCSDLTQKVIRNQVLEKGLRGKTTTKKQVKAGLGNLKTGGLMERSWALESDGLSASQAPSLAGSFTLGNLLTVSSLICIMGKTIVLYFIHMTYSFQPCEAVYLVRLKAIRHVNEVKLATQMWVSPSSH